MRRGAVLLVILCMLAVASTTSLAQTAEGRRIGWLTTEHPSAAALASYRDAIRQALVGQVNLRQLTFEERHVAGRLDQLPVHAAELVRLKVNAILAVGTEAARAALQATRTIPIVVLASDPVAGGLVQTLDDPGGNVTGVAFESAELAPRRLQILKELVPKLSVLAVVSHGASPVSAGEVRAITTTAKGLGVDARPVEGPTVAALRAALVAATAARVDGMVVPSEPWLLGDARGVVELAARNRLPTVYPFSEFPEEGGLAAYGPNLRAMYRRAGSYLGRVVSGTRPRDLPMERPSRFELVVNVRTAKSLGLTVPPALLAAADRIVH